MASIQLPATDALYMSLVDSEVSYSMIIVIIKHNLSGHPQVSSGIRRHPRATGQVSRLRYMINPTKGGGHQRLANGRLRAGIPRCPVLPTF